MGCHIFDPVFDALALTAPVSVRSEGAAPNEHSWATDAIVHYVFPGTALHGGEDGRGDVVRWETAPARGDAEAGARSGGDPGDKPNKLPDQGSIFHRDATA